MENPSQSYGALLAIGLWDHLTQTNASCLNPQTSQYSIYLPPEGWKAELTLMLVIYQDGLPVRIQ